MLLSLEPEGSLGSSGLLLHKAIRTFDTHRPLTTNSRSHRRPPHRFTTGKFLTVRSDLIVIHRISATNVVLMHMGVVNNDFDFPFCQKKSDIVLIFIGNVIV